jgi:hypothetical protein
MGNNNEAARIALAAVNNQIGKTFAGGNGKVLRAERSGYDVWAVVACTQCSQNQNVTVRKLGDLLRYPAERLNFACANPQCPSRTAPAKPALESANLRWIAEKEFRERRQPAGIPVELARAYTKIYNAFGRDTAGMADEHPQFITREQYLSLDATTRAGWDTWAASVPGAFSKKA